MVNSNAPRALKPHRFNATFETPKTPRYWLGGRRVETHLMNALGLIFPLGERFFVRAVRSVLPRLTDLHLIAEAKGFVAQEVHHAYQHERSFEALEVYGYKPRELAEKIERFVESLESRMSLETRLSVTAALEHFTATFAEVAFEKDFLADASEQMKELFLWHAAEEIEHKCVAFDLLQVIDPSYSRRLLGMVLALPLLLGLWHVATASLVLSEQPRAPLSALKEWLTAALTGRLALREMVGAIPDYLRRDFHPAQEDNFHRAEQFFATRATSRSPRAASR